MSPLFPISGSIGVLCSPVFPPWLSGGTKEKASLKGSLLDIVVIVLLSGRNTVASCLGWQTTLNVVSMLVIYLVWGPTAPLLRRLPEWTLRLPVELRFVPVLAGWKKGKRPQLSFFVSRKSELLIGLFAAMRADHGSIVSHTNDLCRVFPSFYASLFTAEATDPAIANSLLANVSFTLPPTQADLYDGRLDPDECFVAFLKGYGQRQFA